MKLKMNILLFLIAGVIILLLILFIPVTLKAQTLKPKIKHYIEYTEPIEYLSDPLVGWSAFYGTSSADDAAKYREEVAPLSPERFIRRIKMLFGVDITGHMDDDKGHLYFSEYVAVFPSTQLVKIKQARIGKSNLATPGIGSLSEEKKEYIEEWGELISDKYWFSYFRPLSFSDIMLYCKWIYYGDTVAYNNIKKMDEKCPILDAIDGSKTQMHILARHYRTAVYDRRDGYFEGAMGDFDDDMCYAPALTNDIEFIQILNAVGRDRSLNTVKETDHFKVGFDMMSMAIEFFNDQKHSEILFFRPSDDEVHYISKPSAYTLRNDNWLMGCINYINCVLEIPNYVSIMSGSVRDFLREYKSEFEKYDYFGYTLLRQIAKTGKVDNSKIGVPLTALAQNPAPLQLDPQESSIVFDTLHGDELFTVYEMGYDNYYLAQCIKPVEEWNKRDENGYAMCTGRMERVWGYVPKKDVALVTSSQTPIRPFIDWGVVSDADGYVNLRDKSDSSKIVEKITSGQWVKIISYDMRNYLVETKDGIQGRIHKSRVIW